MPLHLDPSVALALGLAVPLVPEVVPVATEPSGGG
jgi:hypothetical protein